MREEQHAATTRREQRTAAYIQANSVRFFVPRPMDPQAKM